MIDYKKMNTYSAGCCGKQKVRATKKTRLDRKILLSARCHVLVSACLQPAYKLPIFFCILGLWRFFLFTQITRDENTGERLRIAKIKMLAHDLLTSSDNTSDVAAAIISFRIDVSR